MRQPLSLSLQIMGQVQGRITVRKEVWLTELNGTQLRWALVRVTELN